MERGLKRQGMQVTAVAGGMRDDGKRLREKGGMKVKCLKEGEVGGRSDGEVQGLGGCGGGGVKKKQLKGRNKKQGSRRERGPDEMSKGVMSRGRKVMNHYI